MIHERGSQITKHAHELSWCHGRLQQVFSCLLRACNQKTFGLKCTCDGLFYLILSPYLQVDVDELLALFDWWQLPQGCCWSRSRRICCQRKMRTFAYTPWRTPWRRSSVARHQCDGTVAPLSKNLVDRTVGTSWKYTARPQVYFGHIDLPNPRDLGPSACSGCSTWGWWRSWRRLFEQIQSHAISRTNRYLPKSCRNRSLAFNRVCDWQLACVHPYFSRICFPLPVHYWCHGATKTAQRTPWTVPAADIWSRSQNGTQGGLDLEVSCIVT